jgi:predicted HTH domain antitoxin
MGIGMENLQIRLAEDELAEVEELTRMLHRSRSEVARSALHEGMRAMRMEMAQAKYLRNEFTLCRAAEFAQVSIQEMADYLAKRDVQFFRYSPAELDRDVKVARSLRKTGG